MFVVVPLFVLFGFKYLSLIFKSDEDTLLLKYLFFHIEEYLQKVRQFEVKDEKKKIPKAVQLQEMLSILSLLLLTRE